ncbi:MAG: beta-1,6-N-acetylglucosaminyltransferase [Rhodobacteraceae bacterium]|nr:beta-1,6-N-acetylglucosaminyltransferase [Paracoccaceae bacterium]
MAKIAFILLCHKDPEAIVKQAQSLTSAGDYIAIHFDARASRAAYAQIRAALKTNPNVTFTTPRCKCGWGEWSLVQATLHTLKAAVSAFPRASHFYMLSGDCMAIKSAEYAKAFLDDRDMDYIENHDYFQSDWIKTGWKEERLIYRHWFNERTQKRRFYAMFNLQKRLGLTRAIPADITVRIGSQWWCLRRRTVEAILNFARNRPDVTRFFATTWIPDETFFQTLVHHMIPTSEIENRTLTFLMFSDYGMPVTFYNDHYGLLLGQDFLFARKISPEATDLKRRLSVLFASEGTDFPISNEGHALYHFLTNRGRVGRRFAQPFWKQESSLGRDRELMIVASKKWDVAKRLIARIREMTNLPCIEYLFNEEATVLPDLGGIQTSMIKRNRHRRALMRMLFDFHRTNRLVICIDPSSLDLIEDFAADRSTTRILEIDTQFSDAYLAGHATRIGLAGDQTSAEALSRLLPTIRRDITHDSDQLRDREFKYFNRLREGADPAENARHLAAFLALSLDQAAEIAETPNLFND